MCLSCLLLPVIVGLLCAFFGYLLGKSMSSKGDGTNYASVKADLEACRTNSKNLSSKIVQLEHELDHIKTPGGIHFPPTSSGETPMAAAHQVEGISTSPSAVFDAAVAKAALGKTVKANDLTAIEGVGPKIAELFIAAGINNWQDLSETSVGKCEEILKAAGDRFSIHNPGTWPRQAKLMVEGKWEELKAWTDILDGGKE
jgi:predicted flap endonuclease-1-like 5' DNA nuclease